MESYRYTAKDQNSYVTLINIICDQVNAVITLNPTTKTIIVNSRYNDEDVFKFIGSRIDENGLSYWIQPSDSVVYDSITEMIDDDDVDREILRDSCESLHKEIELLKLNFADELKTKDNIIDSITKSRDEFKSIFITKANENDRIKEQVKAIGVLLNAIK